MYNKRRYLGKVGKFRKYNGIGRRIWKEDKNEDNGKNKIQKQKIL